MVGGMMWRLVRWLRRMSLKGRRGLVKEGVEGGRVDGLVEGDIDQSTELGVEDCARHHAVGTRLIRAGRRRNGGGRSGAAEEGCSGCSGYCTLAVGPFTLVHGGVTLLLVEEVSPGRETADAGTVPAGSGGSARSRAATGDR